MHDPDVLRIVHLNARASVHLKSWMPGRTLPFAAPAECRLLTLAPGEWLLISDSLAAHKLSEQAHHLLQQGVAGMVPSPGLAAIQVEGSALWEVLGKSCGLDLHPSNFSAGACTRTRLARLPVIIDYIDVKPRFDLYVGRSYLSYLCSWLNDAVGILARDDGHSSLGGAV